MELILRSLSFTVYGDPVAKARARAVGFKNTSGEVKVRMFTPSKTEHFESTVAAAAMDEMNSNGFEAFDKPISMSLTVVVAIPSSWSKKKKALAEGELVCHTAKPDLDNVLKAVLDAMNEVVYLDDKQVCHYHDMKKIYGKVPRIEVKLNEFTSF